MISYSVIFELCADIVSAALPISVAFTLTNIIVRTFLNAAFGGKLEV